MAKNEVLEAVLKDGKLYCEKCGELLGRLDDYYSIDHFGEKLTLFIRYCTKCTAKSQYQIKLSVNKREVFVFPMDECKKIKEEKNVFKEGKE